MIRRLAGQHVLVVDDDELIRMVASTLLAEEGAQVSTAANGAQAVAACLSPQATFDVVLMDVQMPLLNGLDATSTIRRHRTAAELPVIGQSSKTTPEDRAAAVNAGMNAYLGKPFDIEQVVEAILRHVRVR